jgi:hypothetical protein
MRDLLKKIDETQAEYLAAVETQPQKVTQEIAGRLKKLREELAATIVNGAVPCRVKCVGISPGDVAKADVVFDDDARDRNDSPIVIVLREGCGETPHGLMHTTGFEVGCTNCGDARDRRFRSKGVLPPIAVDAWNQQQDRLAELLAKGA